MASAPLAATDVHAKALALNLDETIYGSFAEIGAGQEVARWFLSVGAASGTVAQTISAYDKTVSDETYGAGTRYVSKERLLAMLDHEYHLLLTRLTPARGPVSRFFAFADTISARNYQGTNEQHGWLGIRFQAEPGGDPSDLLLHIRLNDSTAQLQQQAVGLLGVNLVYAAYHQRSSPEFLLDALFTELSVARIEIDVLELSGPTFSGEDSRLWSLQLVRRGLSPAIVFDSKALVTEPSSVLRKRPLIVHRRISDEPAVFQPDMAAAKRQLIAEGLHGDREPATVSAAPLLQSDSAEVLLQIVQLAKSGPVIVSSFTETYQLTQYLRRFTSEPIRFALAISSFAKLIKQRSHDPGTLFEKLGKVLANDVKFYVAPMPVDAFLDELGGPSEDFLLNASEDGLVNVDSMLPKPPTHHLYRYLRDAEWVVSLKT